jgi:flagellin
MTVINTNILSQIAQNNLNKTQSSLTSAITQLSSGLKINSAADDPAGLAIAGRLQAQINGQTTAQANANGGISLAQTGQSALNQITNNLQTIRQLAVQASNATYSAADRASLNQEVQQSLAQINTIASTTNFNGQALLDGTFGTQNFQIGSNAGQTIAVNLSAGAKTSQIGQVSSTTFSLQGTTGLSSGNLNVTLGSNAAITIANSVAGTESGQSSDSAYAASAAINAANITGLTASATNSQNFTFGSVQNGSTTDSETYNLTINGVNVFGPSGLSVAASGSVSATSTLNAINSVSSQTGVTAALGADGQTFTLTAADGRNIAVTQSNIAGSGGTTDVTGGLSNSGSLAALAAGTHSSASGQLLGSVTLSSSSSVVLSGTTADAIASQSVNVINGADNLQSTQTIASQGYTTGTSGTLTFALGGTAIGSGVTVLSTDNQNTVAQKINGDASLQAAGITASIDSQGALVVTNTSGKSLGITDTGATGLGNATTTTGTGFNSTNAGTFQLKLGGNNVGGAIAIAAGEAVGNVASAINADSALKAAGISAGVSGGELVITNTSGKALTAADTTTVSGLAGLPAAATTGTWTQTTTQTSYTAGSTGSLANVDVLTVADAQKTIQSVDAALNQISQIQGQLGAVQNRFTSTISNLTASTQNASSTQSSIQDTDYASAAAALSRAQVLSQAATAMVAQANQLPQQVLKLLQ